MSKLKDEYFIELNEFVFEMADVDFYFSEHYLDQEIVLTPDKIETETSIQLVIEIDENNNIQIGAIPPMYYVETTFMPVFHKIRLNIETQD